MTHCVISHHHQSWNEHFWLTLGVEVAAGECALRGLGEDIMVLFLDLGKDIFELRPEAQRIRIRSALSQLWVLKATLKMGQVSKLKLFLSYQKKCNQNSTQKWSRVLLKEAKYWNTLGLIFTTKQKYKLATLKCKH